MNSQNYFHQYSIVKVQSPVQFLSVNADKSDLRSYIDGYLPITGLSFLQLCNFIVTLLPRGTQSDRSLERIF